MGFRSFTIAFDQSVNVAQIEKFLNVQFSRTRPFDGGEERYAEIGWLDISLNTAMKNWFGEGGDWKIEMWFTSRHTLSWTYIGIHTALALVQDLYIHGYSGTCKGVYDNGLAVMLVTPKEQLIEKSFHIVLQDLARLDHYRWQVCDRIP